MHTHKKDFNLKDTLGFFFLFFFKAGFYNY